MTRDQITEMIDNLLDACVYYERAETGFVKSARRDFHQEKNNLIAFIEGRLNERDHLYGYVNGLLGLLQLVRGRDDMPAEIGKVLNTNHRATDAAAYLTQITPPSEPDNASHSSPIGTER